MELIAVEVLGNFKCNVWFVTLKDLHLIELNWLPIARRTTRVRQNENEKPKSTGERVKTKWIQFSIYIRTRISNFSPKVTNNLQLFDSRQFGFSKSFFLSFFSLFSCYGYTIEAFWWRLPKLSSGPMCFTVDSLLHWQLLHDNIWHLNIAVAAGAFHARSNKWMGKTTQFLCDKNGCNTYSDIVRVILIPTKMNSLANGPCSLCI